MSDAAFKTAKYPSYTTAELRAAVAQYAELRAAVAQYAELGKPADGMVAEIERRERVAAGDWSVMTSAERLRAIKAGA